MALPENFGSFEHLQKAYKQQFNQQVKEYFQDLGETWEPEINTSRGSLRVACTMTDEDSALVMLSRHLFFYDVLGYGRSDLAIYYGDTLDKSSITLNHPQLFLYFSQDSQAVPANGTRIDHEKSCRLTRYACKTGETLPAITKANLLDIAREIKTLFVQGQKGITYTCGKISVSYTDPVNGFNRGNYFLVSDETEGIELYKKLCSAIDRPFDLSKINVGTPKKNSTAQGSSGTDTILGQAYKHRAYRPVANLRFRYAYASFGTTAPPIFLIDTTYRHTALVS